MNAVVYDRYGSFDVLSYKQVADPVPAAGQVLIRAKAAAVHVGDCFAVHGEPYAMRLQTGLFRPKTGVPGFDVSGVVESVGQSVRTFAPGDEVFGVGNGTCAELVCADASTLALRPKRLSFAESAVLPTSGLAALHALRDIAKLGRGQRVLVVGASGGVGLFAVQIAKSLGAEVTGVCSGRNVELVRSIGADHVIDYTREDFAKGSARYDLVFDNVENRSVADCRSVLTADGMLICNSGTGATGLRMLVRLVRPLLLNPFVRHKLRRYLSMPNHADLVQLAELAERGVLRPVIAQTFPLAQTRDALAFVQSGHAAGKVVVQIA